MLLLVCLALLPLLIEDLVGENPVYLGGRVFLVKDVHNVDDVGRLEHVGVICKGPDGQMVSIDVELFIRLA